MLQGAAVCCLMPAASAANVCTAERLLALTVWCGAVSTNNSSSHSSKPPLYVSSNAHMNRRFANNTHLETPQYKLTGPGAAAATKMFSKAAQRWWASIVAEKHSLSKPVFYLGLGNWTVTNMPSMGARERTAGNVQLRDLGSRGFWAAGDRLCWGVQVRTATGETAQQTDDTRACVQPPTVALNAQHAYGYAC
jgi:hypothetical protein